MAGHPSPIERTGTGIVLPAQQRGIVVASDGARSALTRRSVLKLGFWTAIGATVFGMGASVLNSLWPRGVSGFGGPVVVPAASVPKPGDPPLKSIEGRFLLVNLAPGEGLLHADDAASGEAGTDGTAAASGGLVALWTRCPHLGCTVPWRADVTYDDGSGRRGWFQCPCHGSTYTKAGVRVFGPAPRSMDTMLIEVDEAGNVVVQTGERLDGDVANPSRALPWPPQPPA